MEFSEGNGSPSRFVVERKERHFYRESACERISSSRRSINRNLTKVSLSCDRRGFPGQAECISILHRKKENVSTGNIWVS